MADRERFKAAAVTITDASIDPDFPQFVEVTLSANTATFTNNGVAGTLQTSNGIEAIISSQRTALNKFYLEAADTLTNNGPVTITGLTGITFVGGALLTLPAVANMHV